MLAAAWSLIDLVRFLWIGYGADSGDSFAVAAIAYGVRILRPRRPEKTRLTRVSSGSAPLIASAQAVGILASGYRRKPVPISTADAPRIKAAATPLGSPIPPDATTGTETALLTAGSKENKPTIFLSASAALKAPL